MAAFKKVALMVLGTAMQTYGQKLTDEQEVLCAAADILIDIYAAESAVLRAREAVASRRSDARVCTRPRRASSSTMRHSAFRHRPPRRSRRWPKATRCGRCSRRSGGC